MVPSPEQLLLALDFGSVVRAGLEWYAAMVLAVFGLISLVGAVRSHWF